MSSGIPPTKALETMMAEQVENINEETEDLPSDFAHPTKNANISVAELLEDLQDRSGSSVRTPFPVCVYFYFFYAASLFEIGRASCRERVFRAV